MRLRRFGALLFALAPASLHGQSEQTVEGAQQFLQMTSAQHDYTFYAGYSEIQRAKIIRTGHCLTEITGAFKFSLNWSTELGTFGKSSSPNLSNEENLKIYIDTLKSYLRTFPEEAEKLARSRPTYPKIIDWMKVTSVKMEYGFISIDQSGEDGGVFIKAPSEDLSARMLYAAEFLRQNCDAASSTGF